MTPYEVGSILERGVNTPTGKLELYSERIAAHPEWGLDALPTYRPPYNPDPEQYPFLLCAGTRIIPVCTMCPGSAACCPIRWWR